MSAPSLHDEGQLLGHITMELELVREKMNAIAGFPRR